MLCKSIVLKLRVAVNIICMNKKGPRWKIFAACEKTLGGICPLNSRAAQSDPRLGETKTAVNVITETKTMAFYVQCHGITVGGFWKKKMEKRSEMGKGPCCQIKMRRRGRSI